MSWLSTINPIFVVSCECELTALAYVGLMELIEQSRFVSTYGSHRTIFTSHRDGALESLRSSGFHFDDARVSFSLRSTQLNPSGSD